MKEEQKMNEHLRYFLRRLRQRLRMCRKIGSFLRMFSAKSGAKPFKEIPGPRGFLGIGNFYNYFKIFGKYSFDELHISGMKKYQEYGSIVCERMLPGVSIVWLYDPDDIAHLYKSDERGNYPCRQSHLALAKYREDRPNVYRSSGLLPTNGEEWWRMRAELQKGLSKPQNVRNFLPSVDEIVAEFINNLLGSCTESKEIDDMLEEISRLNLELTCLLAFDERMNSFANDQRHPDSMSSRLMAAADETNSVILPLDQSVPVWRLWETPEYRQLRKSQEYLEEVAIKLVSKKKANAGNGNSLLDQYLRNPKLDVKDLHGMAADLLLAGVHTSAYTTSFVLYHISNDQRVQELMFEEAVKILPNEDDSLTPSMMNSDISYTRAVLKESLRLNPISVGVGRILNNDAIFSGFHVPKKTVIVTQNQISCRLEKYFVDPAKFSPERWLKSCGQKKDDIHSYLVLPFGHGTRSCIARRFAEQNILVFLMRLVRKYKIHWTGVEQLGLKTKLINQPSSKISLRFERRHI